jgi:protein TonB
MSFMPVTKEKKMGEEFFARLVSPDEFFAKVPFVPAISKVRPFPPSRSRTSQPKTFISAPLPSSKHLPPSQPQSPPASPGQGVESRSEIKGTMQKPGVSVPSIRERLFDRGIIGDIAKREVKKEEKEARTFSFDVKDLQYSGYLQRLKERIETIWIYPPDAAAKGIYGELVIEFTIKKNGSLGAVELIRTSGHKNLDDAAIKALRDAEPFWPLPKEWGVEAYTIKGHFVYNIYGYYYIR